ncbi:MAG: RsmE family RNA methyltransferase [candidate division KSB1 bacterium]|nr:RsmE family RNA methyltransferase [candidate division KSB1 bacterium]MDQ7062953.1 RsmE family RNA methyltransferase [candidate division KSB1 bacterium]
MARKDYFYVRPEDVTYKERRPIAFRLRDDEFRHLKKVLRHEVGDTVWAVDGQGLALFGEIMRMDQSFADVKVLQTQPQLGESGFRLTLAVCLPKLPRFELVLEKGTELGVHAFMPVISRYSVVKPSASKVERWQRIAVAAMKQCGRSRLPEIHPPVPFDRLLADSREFDFRWIAHAPVPDRAALWSPAALQGLDPAGRRGVLLIGPEGGFGDEEIRRAVEHEFEFMTLGPRRLRTETAALVSAALLLRQFGDLGE